MNYVTRFEEAAAAHAADTAVFHEDTEITYGDLADEVDRLASGLRSLGLQPGDRVGLMLNNRREFVTTYYATGKAGLAVVLVNTLLKRDEIAYILEDSGCAALVANAAGAAEFGPVAGRTAGFRHLITVDRVEGAVPFMSVVDAGSPGTPTHPADDDDVPEIKYTSGTTGRPKGVMHTHRNIVRFVETVTSAYPRREDDRVLCCVPLYHGFGDMCLMHPTLFSGGSMVLQDPFDPAAVLRDIARHRCTILAGVPAMFFVLSSVLEGEQEPPDVSSLRLVFSGGQAITPDVLETFERRFGCTVYEGYGLTESTAGSAGGLPDRPRKLGSVGLPLPGVEIRIVGDDGRPVPSGTAGEILVRSDLNMKGYLGRPEETAEVLRGGWLHTGDIGRFDADGYLYLVDRKKDVIITSGENVYPREVEEVLAAHPAVAQVAVVAMPDPRRGEVPKAVVALAGAAAATEDELIAWCAERLARFKVPRAVEIRDALPVGPTGKVAKKDL